MGNTNETRVVHEFYDAVGRDDLEAALDRLSDGIEWNVNGRAPFSGRRRGRDEVRAYFETRARLVRVDRFDVREFIARGDQVVALGSERLTSRETGGHAEHDFAQVFTIRDGKITSAELFQDTHAVESLFGETAAERRAGVGPMGVTEPPFSGHGGEAL